MMQQVEINVGVEKDKKGAKGADKSVGAPINRSLSSSRLRESFNLNFESLFLDMFTEVPVAKPAKVETARASEGTEHAAAPADAARPVAREDRRDGEAHPVVAEGGEARAASAPADAETGADHADGARAVVEAPRESGDHRVAADAHDAKPVEKVESATAHVKVIRVELSGKLAQSLSEDKLSDLKKKIEDLLSNDGLTLQQMMAGALNIVADIVGPQHAKEVCDCGSDLAGEDARKFLKKFLKDLAKAIDDKPQQQEAAAAVEEAPRAVEARVDEAIAKLVQKMDRKVTDADQQAARDLAKVETKTESKPVEAKVEPPVEAPKIVEFRRETIRTQAPEIRLDDGPASRGAQASLEAGLADAVRARAKTPVITAPLATPGAVSGIGEVSRSGRSEGQSLSWQNSYNQNSATKFSDRAAETRRSDAPQRPVQNPIFDQIVQNAKITVTDGKGEAVIKLNPEFLGKVEMKVVVEDGKVNVKFTAENDAVRQTIADNVQELKKSLAEAGLEVENVSVLVGGQFAETDAREEDAARENGSRGRSGRGGAGDEEDDTSFETVRSVIEDGSTVRYVA